MHEQGPFDRILRTSPERDRTAAYVVAVIIGLGLLLLILVLPPVSILSRGEGSEEGGLGGIITSAARGNLPQLPEGFESLSPLYDISAPEDLRGTAVITVNLHAPQTDERNLALYTFVDGRWQRLAGASLVNDGTAAQGEVPLLPDNIAVLRRTETVRQVTGWLPSGAELDPRAGLSLTVLNPVDFAPASDGSLMGSPTPVPPDAPYQVYPTVRAASPEEAQALDIILSSPELRETHVNAIVEMVRSGAYGGVELDYRGVNASRRDEFLELVQALAEQLHGDGRGITMLLPLPVREGAEWDTGGYDWERLGATVDAIKLAPETDESLYYRRMEEVLDFLTQRVDRGKLLLVVGPLSREKSGEGIRSLTLTEALALASLPGLRAEGDIVPGQTVRVVGENLVEEEGASGIHWDDEEALAVTFSYPGRGGKRTMWIGNVFSVVFKLDLARRYGLGGVAIEDVSLTAGQADIWPAIQEYADAGSVSLVRPNGDLLTPRWVASAGELDTEMGSAVQWQTPPEPGVYEVTLIVSDGVVRVGQRLAVEVLAPAGEASP